MNEYIFGFSTDVRTVTLFTLIICDLFLGIIVALKFHIFDLNKIAQFYRTNVIPFILGYLLIYTITFYGIVEYVNDPIVSEIMTQITATVGWFPGILKLSHSVKMKLSYLNGEKVITQ